MKEKRRVDNIKCEICGYHNHKEYVMFSGVCHGCGAVLDEKAYFKAQMNKKLRLWKNKKWR